jgi:CHAT domain-containing protein
MRYARAEAEEIWGFVSGENVVVLGDDINSAPATVENVLSHLKDTSIAHFACCSGGAEPLKSGLMLKDGEILTISHVMQQYMPNAELAFLSSGENVIGEVDLPDESLHLAASMLFAGFRGVVTTMW